MNDSRNRLGLIGVGEIGPCRDVGDTRECGILSAHYRKAFQSPTLHTRSSSGVNLSAHYMSLPISSCRVSFPVIVVDWVRPRETLLRSHWQNYLMFTPESVSHTRNGTKSHSDVHRI